jgi:hypothetical protein
MANSNQRCIRRLQYPQIARFFLTAIHADDAAWTAPGFDRPDFTGACVTRLAVSEDNVKPWL